MASLKSNVKKNLPGVFSLLSALKRTALGILVGFQKKSLLPKMEAYYKGNPEVEEVLSFLRENPMEMIPYSYPKEYEKTPIDVVFDAAEDLYVVQVRGNAIYFPKEMTREYISESVRIALIEQDERSPHKYLPAGALTMGGDVAVLCGASDGIYTLEIIDLFKKIYLFEANPAWIKPIRKTLLRHLDKIEIVPYYIADVDGPGTITLDSFFSGKEQAVNYIQADIEGYELKMLRGATQVLTRSPDLKLALCCYHTAEQEKELTDMLVKLGYTVRASKGFLLLWMQYPLRPPYLRRGVLYAFR